jgi:uroporphyrinogen-III synthase
MTMITSSALGEPTAALAGYTVGVTADRRRDELAGLLENRGARVVLAPALRIVPIADDAELRAATRACLETPPDIVLVNTGIGMRGWLEAADSWGLVDPLRAVLSRAYLIARGP